MRTQTRILVALIGMGLAAFGNGCTPPDDEQREDDAGALQIAVPPAATAPEPAESATADTEAAPQNDAPVESSAPIEAEPSALTTESLVGTTWTLADYSIAFAPDGAVSLNGSAKGTWTVNADTIKVSAAGEEISISIKGGQLFHNGLPMQRQ